MSRCVCPSIIDTRWQDREHVWNKTFFYLPSPHLFTVPLRLGRDIGRVINLARAEGFELVEAPRMLLSRYALFRGELLVEVVDPGAESAHLRRFRDARVYSQVFHGHWRDLGTGVRQLISAVGRRPRTIYFWYVTCPMCAEERGYKTVIFGVL